MCHACSTIASHIYLLTWEIILALPAVILFNSQDGNLPSGLAFFLFVVVVAILGMAFVCLRSCLGWCFATRWATNLLILLYSLLQIAICAWSSYFAYVYIYPFTTTGGFAAYYALNQSELNVSQDAAKVWYIIGATFSLLLAVVSLIAIWSSFSLMTEHFRKREKKEKKEKGSREEKEPLKQGIQYA